MMHNSNVKDSWIDTYKIIPPLPGGLSYGAKAIIIRDDGTKAALHEHYGTTSAEAEMKAQSELDEYKKGR